MRRVSMTMVAGFAIAALALPARGAQAPAKQDAKAAIDQLEKDFAAAWNAHDPKKMASFWEEDGDLINPFGREAKGRPEVEKLLTEEQTTVFKKSTFTTDSNTTRQLSPRIAVADWLATVTGAVDSKGATTPPMKVHVVLVVRENLGQWRTAVARPILYPPPPTQ